MPIITSSPAFQQDGLLEITFDEAEDPTLDSTACCGETTGPGRRRRGTETRVIPVLGGGVRSGLVLISPFIKAGPW